MERLVELFLDVAKIEAQSKKEKAVADYISSFLYKKGCIFYIDESHRQSGSNTGNVICKVGSGGDFVLLSHMDTARPTEKMQPVFESGKIKSAGDTVLGADNRAGISVLLYVLEKINTEKLNVKDFTVAFTTCEETSLAGSKYLDINGSIKKGFVFDSSYRPGNFIHSACGSMGFKATIKGRASHSGLAPEKGINSIEAAGKAISQIRQGRLDEETTANIGRITGGSAVNVVPEETYVEGEVRSFNRTKVDREILSIHECFKSAANVAGAELNFDAYWDFEPYTVSPGAEVFNNITEAIKNAGLTPSPVKSLGGSDANSLNARGIPSVNIGIGAQNPHANDEFIFIEDLHKSVEIALQLIKK